MMSDLSSEDRPDRQPKADALERLRREAEMEMRRVLDESRPRKRPRGPQGEEDASFVPIDRYRYSVIQELEAGAKGFIITCNFRQEKSATREVSQLLRRYMPGHLFPQPIRPSKDEQQPTAGTPASQSPLPPAPAPGTVGGSELSQQPGSTVAVEVAPPPPPAAEAEAEANSSDGADDGDLDGGEDGRIGGPGGHGADAGGGYGDDADDADAVRGGGGRGSGGACVARSTLGLAKVGCRGVVLVRLSAAAAAEVDPVKVVEAMLMDLEAGTLQPPKHCQRIIPLDATCLPTTAGLTAAVAEAAAAFKRRQSTPGQGGVDTTANAAAMEPFSYAITYHSRGTEPPSPTAGPEQQQQQQQPASTAEILSDRGCIISLVAEGMAVAFGQAAKVNLKKPQVAVLVESVPVACKQIAALTLLPERMFISKGKLVVKPLVKNARP